MMKKTQKNKNDSKRIGIKNVPWELIVLVLLLAFIFAFIIFIGSGVPAKSELYPGS